MTTKAIKTMFLGAALAAFLLPAAAQSTTDNSSTTGGTPPSTVDKAPGSTTGGPSADKDTHIGTRKDNEQKRIQEGIKSGRLTPQEAAQLEKQQKRIRQETRQMRAANGGKLTAAEKAKIQRQQNRASQRIHAQKHDKPGR